MPRQARTRVPQPVFHEPNFGEQVSTPDPTGFETQHPNDSAVYDEVKDLLKKDVVSFDKSRAPTATCFNSSTPTAVMAPSSSRRSRMRERSSFMHSAIPELPMHASTSMSSESRIRSAWIATGRTMQTARH